ncbi:hypothetical protein AVEN_108437-1 [Araneus ventricosus]|uniref:Uncharacterized protein n=1 Tax=Araneus ventricosus TaxID=182803 RepID=A0A4Y2MEH6_ARAVE|nr:hypothetical protein AVEN_108437-1 [Araneus ventricosus]
MPCGHWERRVRYYLWLPLLTGQRGSQPPLGTPSPSGSQEGFNYNHPARQGTMQQRQRSFYARSVMRQTSCQALMCCCYRNYPLHLSGEERMCNSFNTCYDNLQGGRGHSEGNESDGKKDPFWFLGWIRSFRSISGLMRMWRGCSHDGLVEV